MSSHFDERDAFVQLIFKSVAVTVALTFVVAALIDFARTDLAKSLFVPIGCALFLGTLALQVEFGRRFYVLGILWLFLALLLLPGTGWILLMVGHIPYDSTEAKFIPLLPQAVLAPTFFEIIRKRWYKAHPIEKR